MLRAGHPLTVALADLSTAAADAARALAAEEPPNVRLSHDDPIVERLLFLLETLMRKVLAMSSSLDSAINQLLADNAQLQAAVTAAPAEIATLIAAAVAAQVQAGVTPAQLQSLADLHAALGGEVGQLTAALAGTPPPTPATGTSTVTGGDGTRTLTGAATSP